MNAESALPTIDVSSEVLRTLRERTGLSITETATRVSELLRGLDLPAVSSVEVQNWEAGSARPTVADAEVLAEVLLVPFTVLVSAKPPRPTRYDFRKGNGGHVGPLSYQALRKLAQFDAFYRLAQELSQVAGTVEEVSVPAVPRGILRDQAVVEEIGSKIRQAIGLTSERQLAWAKEQEAFADLRACVESSGVFVFAFSLPVDEVRGLSKWERGGPPALLVNTADSPSAQLFTLMHEYAHLVAASPERTFVCDPSSPSLEAESLANKIAAASLVPDSSLRPKLTNAPTHLPYDLWPRDLRMELKRAFRVSHPVIGIRLTQLGFATGPGAVKSFWKRGRGFGRSNATTAQRYRRWLGPKTLGLAGQAVKREDLSIASISRILGIRVDHVLAMLEA